MSSPSRPTAGTSTSTAGQTPSIVNGIIVEGQPGTSVDTPPTQQPAPNPLETLEDMTAFVERTRAEEESIRRKREEVELQLLRMRQQEAVRMQQAIRMRMATDRANAAILQQQGSSPSASATGSMDGQQQQQQPLSSMQPAGSGAAVDAPAPAWPGSGPGPAPGPGSGAPKKKLMLKKSKRMTAVAAAAGLHRLSPTSPSGAAARPASGGMAGTASAFAAAMASPSRPAGAAAALAPAGSAGLPVAMLSREEIFERERKDAAKKNGSSAGEAVLGEAGGSDSDADVGGVDAVVVPKPIFIISDCTGESAARTVRAALNQFELRCRTTAPAQFMVFRFVEDVEKIGNIIKEAAKEDALVVYTLVDPKMVKAARTACSLYSVRYVDLWTELLDSMEVHLNAVRSGVPRSVTEARRPTASLTAEYFKMIEAVEYTRKMDDGANPREWKHADLLILGVSRCGKTPLSIYLGQRGYKVANLPLVPGCPLPKELFEIDQTRIVGLSIDSAVLASIRRNRVTQMGVSRSTQAIDYAEIKKINSELEWARALYNEHPHWPVLDVTMRGIEETAARILKILNDRRGDSSPQWVEEYHQQQLAAERERERRERAAAVLATRQISSAVGRETGSVGSSDDESDAFAPQLEDLVARDVGTPETAVFGAYEGGAYGSYLMQGLY